MKHLKIVLIPLLMFYEAHTAIAPYFQPRSASVDSSRELAGWTHLVNQFDPERVYGVTGLTLEYTQSFRNHEITNSLFGTLLQNSPSNCQELVISGSQYPNRNANDLLADYFGLPTDFKSIITFNPAIRNVILDFDFYLGLDNWLCGMYFRIHMPIVHTWWNLHYCERIVNHGRLGYSPGYFNDSLTGVGTGLLLNSFQNYVYDQLAPDLGTNVLFESLKFARMAPATKQLTRPSDLEAAFGWNFLQSDEYHFGFNIRFTAPTGNRPKAHYLFEPIIGNGHHWGIGVGLTAHWLLWMNDPGTKSLGFYVDANVGTLFKAHQTRTFDLVGLPLSRYMLAQLFTSPAVNLLSNPSAATAAGSTAPVGQFANVFRPIANLTSFEVESSFAAQTDITLLLDYAHCGFTFDVGYNFWNLTCEKLRIGCCDTPLHDDANWTLKGDAYVYGFAASDAVDITPNLPIALSATESLATINAGTNTPIGTPFNASQMRNPNIDNPQFAVAATTDNSDQIMVAPFTPADVVPNTNQQRTSNQPIYLTSTNVDIDGARIAGLSQKIFAHVSYEWQRRCGWIPYFGVGGKIELARQENKDCCGSTCSGCIKTNISEWGIWAKGGFAF